MKGKIFTPLKTKFIKYDKLIALIFSLLIVLFFILSIYSEEFFNWMFSRHQNKLSWYIRPLFLIPFCYSSYKRSFAGATGTILFLFTSMFWFPKPEVISEDVRQFLQYESLWLSGDWSLSKIFFVSLVPISLTLLSLSFWKRSLWVGVAVIILIAAGKIIWSIFSAGESGKSIIVPAMIGLVICIGLVMVGIFRLEKRKNIK